MTSFVSYPKYETYRDTSVQWLGIVPSAWKITRLGTVFTERRAKVSDKDFEPLSVTKKGILRQLDSAAKTNDGDNRKLVKKGDFVINSRSDRKGSSGVSPLDGSVSLINIVLQPKGIHPNFCNYVLKSYAFVEEFYRMGHGIVADLWTTRYDEMRGILMALPSSGEQHAISAFLDKKCAKIDEAVKIKENQIALLREQRQIIIQDAVTRGLNPAAHMKDSGIDWIGKIPSTWAIKRLQYVASCNDDTVDEMAIRNTDIKYVDISSVSSAHNTYSFEIQAFLDAPSRARRLVNPGDTIFSTVRPYLKAVATIQDPEPELVVSTGFAVARPRRGTDSTFLGYALRNDAFIAEVTANSVGASYPAINPSNLFKMKIPLPPSVEQLTIAKFLNEKCANIGETVKLKERQIDALKEYKTSLINAAVTGKIKVV
jgi:type I restriction enzyme S subunit